MSWTLYRGLAMAIPSLFSLFLLFTFVLCLSVVAYPYPLPELKLQTHYGTDDSPVAVRDTATFEDVLTLLGTPGPLPPTDIAGKLRACFKYLVPPHAGVNFSNPIEMVTTRSNVEVANNDDDYQIWFGNTAVQELVDHPEAIYNFLDPTYIQVPDVEGSIEAGCELTRTCIYKRFKSHDLNTYQNFLFNLIVKRGCRVGMNVTLNRFDLFHGHLFITKNAGRIGILYHAKEYPAPSPQFPHYLGPCQTESSVAHDAIQMDLRNILWLAPYISGGELVPGILLVLDAHQNGIIYRDLITDDNKPFRTIDEAGFGNITFDINYLNVGRPGSPDYQLYVGECF